MSSTPTSAGALGSCPIDVLIVAISQSNRREYSASRSS